MILCIFISNVSNKFLFKPISTTVSKSTWCLTSTETMKLIRDGEKKERGCGEGGGWGEGDYMPVATLSPPERLLN